MLQFVYEHSLSYMHTVNQSQSMENNIYKQIYQYNKDEIYVPAKQT